jgi:hypothetical protein
MVSWLRWYLAPVACLTPLTGCPQSATITERSFLLRDWIGFSSATWSSRNGHCFSAVLSLFHGPVAASLSHPGLVAEARRVGPPGARDSLDHVQSGCRSQSLCPLIGFYISGFFSYADDFLHWLGPEPSVTT